MPCLFCMAAMSVAVATIVPAMLDDMEKQLRTSAVDLRRVAESRATIQWEGTFAFTASGRARRRASARVTLYKNARRIRIQVMTHELLAEDARILEDHIAALVGATVVSHHAAETAEVVGPLARPQAVEPLRSAAVAEERPDSG